MVTVLNLLIAITPYLIFFFGIGDDSLDYFYDIDSGTL
jgi:hypothetical protein